MGTEKRTEKRTEEQRRAEALALLKHILDIPSVNGKDREQETAVYLAEYLKRKGMETRVQLIDEHHGNVIGVLKGKTEETILFNGHLDTVPYGDINEWNTNPAVCTEQDGRLYARGASDMKSGLAVMAFVLGELAESGCVPQKTIVFAGTCDEERGGLGAKEIIKEYPDLFPELLLIGEPTSCQAGVAQLIFSLYLGSLTDIAATLYAFGLSSLTSAMRAFCADASELPVAKRLSVAVDPASFADEAEALGLVISERSARRILDGEIAPVEPLINRVRIEGEADARPAARPAKAPAGDARGLRIAPEDLESFSRRVACAFSDLARDYYLESAVKPDVRVGKDGVHIRIPVEKLR